MSLCNNNLYIVLHAIMPSCCIYSFVSLILTLATIPTFYIQKSCYCITSDAHLCKCLLTCSSLAMVPQIHGYSFWMAHLWYMRTLFELCLLWEFPLHQYNVKSPLDLPSTVGSMTFCSMEKYILM